MRWSSRPLQGRGYRWRAVTLARRFVPPKTYPDRKLDVYWLSTGRCGTHFVYNLLKISPNLAAFHDLGMHVATAHRAVEEYRQAPENFWRLRLESFSIMHAKIRENDKYPAEVFTELTNSIFPFGYMLWEYYRRELAGTRRIKLVHLVREPRACCRSILKVERDEEGGESFAIRPPAFLEGNTSAEKAAYLWININSLCRQIVDRIDDPDVARTVRIEDLKDVARVRELFDFMELKGFDVNKTQSLLTDDSQMVRHSHLRRQEIATPEASDEEIATIRLLTLPMASEFRY